jgi:hypothetical protein
MLIPESIVDQATIVNNLREKGWAHAGCLQPNLLIEYRDYLDRCSWYNYHVKGGQTNPISDRTQAPSNCSSVSMHDVILAPHWFEMSLQMSEIVKDYFNTKNMILYSYNAFYSNPEGPGYTGVQNWHTDFDSENFVALFMYLTDVMVIEDGPHAFEERNGTRVDIFGPAGTMFFADTRCMHMGHKPKNKPRGLTWARWSTDPNQRTYSIDGLSPIDRSLIGDRFPKDTVLQNIIRKVVC